MQKAYSPVRWENYPSEASPLNEENLNKMDTAIDVIDDRVCSMETTKLDKATANGMVKDVSFNEVTGIFTITYLNGSTSRLDTKMEKLAVNFTYDSAGQRLVVTLEDGTVQYVDMKALVTQYEFIDSTTLVFSADSSGKITATIKAGSITEDMLQPKFLADIRAEVGRAEASAGNAANSADKSAVSAVESSDSAKLSQSYVKGGTGTRNGEDTDNSKYYSEVSRSSAENAAKTAAESAELLEDVRSAASGARFEMDFVNGELLYISPNYHFDINPATGDLEWEVA